MSDGRIVRTFTQRGTGLPLGLARSEGVPRPSLETNSSVTDGRYHNDFTGIEFNVPKELSVVETETRSNPSGLQADLAVTGIPGSPRCGVDG